ncbi:histone H1-like [Acipenser ruthenus]|uniref:histone H1-like n=1 Tax=Acipenser ruthenus TaxID=7906 RepID=UPI002740A81A|nr:histone H1-like [Acipenser ruthenus]
MEEKVATTVASHVKRKAEGPKINKSGPTVSQMIIKAVSDSKERSGLSLTAMKKSLAASGYDVERNNSRVNRAVRTLVNKETLLQTKGTGASGSFRVNKKQAKPKKNQSKRKRFPNIERLLRKKGGTQEVSKERQATGGSENYQEPQKSEKNNG